MLPLAAAEQRWDALDEEAFTAAPLDAEARQTADVVAEAVRSLPRLQREALILFEYEEQSLDEIARAVEGRGNRLTITWGNDVYAIECDGPIAPGGGAFNLYVYPDLSWRPRRGGDEFHLGASYAR